MIKIICWNCGRHIYDLAAAPVVGGDVAAKDFVPVDIYAPKPEDGCEMLCPQCGVNFTLGCGFCSIRVLTDRGVLPKVS